MHSGTRVAAGMIVEALAAGRSLEDLLSDFPAHKSFDHVPLPLRRAPRYHDFPAIDFCGHG
jgi:hypothetical protein